MALVFNIPSFTYPQGFYPFGSVPIAQDVETINLTMTREAWPDIGGNVVSIQLDLSLDGGNTYFNSFLAFTAEGGVIIGRDGNPVTESRASTLLPSQQGATARIIRPTVEFFTDIQSAVTVEVI